MEDIMLMIVFIVFGFVCYYIYKKLKVIFLRSYIYKKLKRISSLEDLPSDIYGLELHGVATFVFDGDGFKFFHVPPFRSSSYTREDKKLHIRLAGIDAPESVFRGQPGQPFGPKSKNTLMKLILKKEITLKLLGIDKYNRLLAICYVNNWFSKTNVNMKMIELGMACVYESSDAIYDNCREEFKRMEAKARENKIGIWSQDLFISPTEFKRMHRE